MTVIRLICCFARAYRQQKRLIGPGQSGFLPPP